ncbi:unnamed protein product, partial [Brassica rapa]
TRAKITRTVHREGQRAESMDQRADMCTYGQPRTSSTNVLCVLTTHTYVPCVLTDTHRRPVPRGPKSPEQSTGRVSVLSPRTNVLICVLMDSHGRSPRTSCVCWRTPTDVLPRGPKSPKQSTGRASVQSPRTNVLICVLMDSHERPVCADGHTQTATNVLCVLTDTHGRPVCADGQPQTA